MSMVRACLLLLLAAGPAFGQPAPGRRIDVLTGEPPRPRSDRPEPEIFNAPHAPRQPTQPTNGPPLEIYVAPQIGADTGYGAAPLPGPTPGRTLRQYRRDATNQPEPRWRRQPDLRHTGPIAPPNGPGIFDRIRQ